MLMNIYGIKNSTNTYVYYISLYIHFSLAYLSFQNISCIMHFFVGLYGYCFHSCFKYIVQQFYLNHLTDKLVSMIKICQCQWSSSVSLLTPPPPSLWATVLSVESIDLSVDTHREKSVLCVNDWGYTIPCLCAREGALPALILINYIAELIVWSVSLQKCVWNDLLSGWTKEMKY